MSENDILLINRDKKFLDQMASALQSAGYRVHTAAQMRGALSILSDRPVKLIICDKDLQDISGYDFLRFIKSDPLREKIPFMFLVPITDQGRAFKAFELGAVDFLVYPINAQEIVGRIREACSSSAPSAKPAPAASATPVTPAAPAAPKKEPQPVINPLQEQQQAHEKRVHKRIPAKPLKIDLSRDGVIWMPGMIKNFSLHGLFVETSLFGKPGVRLMIRFIVPEGTFIVNSHIKHIRFDDFQKPAGLGIEVEEDETWRRLYEKISQSSRPAPETDAQAQQSPQQQHDTAEKSTVSEIESTIILTPDDDGTLISNGTTAQAGSGKKPSYDIRFYHSLIGKQLDNYRAITLIGAGSMGGVLQGWDVALEREVALKIISYELSSKENFREMFIKEARVISKLNHPNIAQIYSIGSSNDILYYAMEFIDGVTLKDVIDREGNIHSLKGLDYLSTVCDAMETVYQSSVVHRDIKPANIMINNRGIVKIVDFGVAKLSNAKTKGYDKNMIMGSPLYMAPEQIAGLVLDHRSDMYSLGATFYHAFSGAPPFESEDFKEILDHHLNKPLTPLRNKNPKIAAELCRIIEKMMAKDPNHRYKNFDEIIKELKALRARIADHKGSGQVPG